MISKIAYYISSWHVLLMLGYFHLSTWIQSYKFTILYLAINSAFYFLSGVLCPALPWYLQGSSLSLCNLYNLAPLPLSTCLLISVLVILYLIYYKMKYIWKEIDWFITLIPTSNIIIIGWAFSKYEIMAKSHSSRLDSLNESQTKPKRQWYW